jgi:uncharacterized peroxidase-related enzyme
MAWIKTIKPEEADHRLGRLYRDASAPGGQVDRIMQAHSLAPATLRGHMALYRATMHPASGELSDREREIIGVCVSLANACGYCVEHHAAGLARHVGQKEANALMAVLESGADTDPLTGRERAMLGYARKLTRTPGEMTEGDLKPLRDAGLDDTEILELNQVAAYFAYANRTVLGLGVEIEDEEIGLPPAEGEE